MTTQSGAFARLAASLWTRRSADALRSQRNRRVAGFMMALGLASGDLVAGPPDNEAIAFTQIARAGLGLPFVPNVGQLDPRVGFSASIFAGTMFVTKAGALVYSLPVAADVEAPWQATGWTLVETFEHGTVRPTGVSTTAGAAASFVSAKSTAGSLPTASSFHEVSLGEVWKGIDAKLVHRDGSVEKVFTIAPGIRPSLIRVRMDGVKRLRKGGDGVLVATTGYGDVRFSKPVAYQVIGGRRVEVEVAYSLKGSRYGFTVGRYDRTQPLVIDPLLQSTYLGGSSSDPETVRDVAVHPTTGDIYAAGITWATDFPGTSGGAQSAATGKVAFIARLDAGLTKLIQATYYNGAAAHAIALTATDVYVAGERTTTAPLPGAPGGAIPSGFGTGFVARLSLSLKTLVQASIVPHAVDDMLVHPNGDVYVAAGAAGSPTNTLPNSAGGFQPTSAGVDVAILRFNPALTAIGRSSWLGGTQTEIAISISVKRSTGDLYVGGTTYSVADFPGTVGGAQPTAPQPPTGAPHVGFVSRISADLTQLHQSTFVLGNDIHAGVHGVVVHPLNGDVYAAGHAQTGLPASGSGAFPSSACIQAKQCPFIARLSPLLTSFVQTTYYPADFVAPFFAVLNIPGRTLSFWFRPLAVHPATGDVYLNGSTTNAALPGMTGAVGTNQVNDSYIARFDESLSQLHQATYLGGPAGPGTPLARNYVTRVIFNAGQRHAIAVGATSSANFPGTAGGADPVRGGTWEGFVALLTADLRIASSSCVGFDDVVTTSPFCVNVEWLKNRAVTLGCGAKIYCPETTVTREQMAAFMNRLGTAITPLRLIEEEGSGAVTLGNGSVVCQSADIPIQGYPRRAYIEAIWMGTANTVTEFGADVVASADGGMSWTPLAEQAGRGILPASRWANVRALGSLDLGVGQTIRFGILLTRGGAAGTAPVSDSRCQLRVTIGHRDGTFQPL